MRPTKPLELAVCEPAWSTEFAGLASLIGASVAAVRRVGAHIGLMVSGLAGAHFMRRVGAVAIWSLSGE
jgi:hypothetical protein